jgi:predicted N-acyltransferase
MRDDGVALRQNSERKTSVSQAPARVDNRKSARSTPSATIEILISIHPTIREINPRDWNRLIDGNALAAHGWLLAAEQCWRARWQALYFPLHLEPVSRYWTPSKPKAGRRGLPLSFVQVSTEEAPVRDLLVRRGYLSTRNVPVALMDIPWRSLDAYLSSLPGKRRREFRREMRRNREAGVEIALLDSHTGLEDRLLALFEENARSHRSIGFPFGRQLFEALQEHMAAGSRLFVARKAGEIVGVYLVLRDGSTAVAFAVGVDGEQSDDFTYFQLVYYGLIEHAIQHGIDRVYFGRGMYAAKVRRGCRLLDCFTYTRVSGVGRWLRAPLYGLASAWNRAKVSLELRKS